MTWICPPLSSFLLSLPFLFLTCTAENAPLRQFAVDFFQFFFFFILNGNLMVQRKRKENNYTWLSVQQHKIAFLKVKQGVYRYTTVFSLQQVLKLR